MSQTPDKESGDGNTELTVPKTEDWGTAGGQCRSEHRKKSLFIVFPLDWTGVLGGGGGEVGWGQRPKKRLPSKAWALSEVLTGLRRSTSTTENQCVCRNKGLGMGFVVKISYSSPGNSLYDTGSSRSSCWKHSYLKILDFPLEFWLKE